MTTGLDREVSEEAPPARSRLLLAVGAVLAVVALFGAGLLVGRWSSDAPGSGASAAGSAAGPVEVGFAQDMAAHHAQAVEMATLVLDGSTDPLVRTVAYDILTTQQGQIGRMHAWLDEWGRSYSPSGPRMAWMPSSAGHAHDTPGHTLGPDGRMPGLATQEQLDALRAARGVEADRLFLELMIRHHEGGIPMAEAAAGSSDPQVARLASGIARGQAGEIQLMQSMLTAHGG